MISYITFYASQVSLDRESCEKIWLLQSLYPAVGNRELVKISNSIGYVPRGPLARPVHVELGHLLAGAREDLPRRHAVRPHVALRREVPRLHRRLRRVPAEHDV